MASHPVFRFPIAGQEKSWFLLQVISTQGSKNPLDLRLLGTESTGAFEAKLRHRRVDEWKDNPGHCTNEEWEQILVATFIEPTSPHRQDIEAKVDLEDGAATLVLRKNISGITQRLGSIRLEEFEIKELKDGSDNGPQLFDWCVAAIGDRAKVFHELAVATAKVQELEKSVNELKAQLEDLLKAKEDDERQLLEKFQDLLNEKKLKIRQQQRLLASADVDPARLENLGASQDILSKAKSSRGGKRKAVTEVQDDSDDGFESMDVDSTAQIKDESEEDDPDLDTHQTTDEEMEDPTASEAENSDEDPQQASKSKGTARAKRASKSKSTVKAPSAKDIRGRTSAQNARSMTAKPVKSPADGQEEEEAEPPPRRILPFQSRNKPKEKTPEAARPTSGDETEPDDDEL